MHFILVFKTRKYDPIYDVMLTEDLIVFYLK